MRIPQLGMVALLAGMLATASSASANQLTASCKPKEQPSGERVICQLRSVSGETLSEVKAQDDTGRQLDLTAERYSWTRNRTAVYFLVQVSDINADQLRRVAQFLERAASPVGERKVGIATVDYGFTERAALGAFRLQVEREVQAIATASTSRAYPEITDHIREPLDKLAKIEADRRALVIVSDGASSAGSAKERELADFARSKEIMIYNVVVAKSDRPQSSVLNRLTERTDGASRDVSTGTSSDVTKLATDIFNLIESGSVVDIDAKGLPKETEITLKATVGGDRQVTASPVAVSRLTEDKIEDRVMDFITQNMFALLAGLGLMIGFAMIIGSVVLPRRRRRNEMAAEDQYAAPAAAAEEPDSVPGPMTDPNAPTEIVMKSAPGGAAASAPLGWLELVGADAPRMPLQVGTTRLGRHRENEICLMNNSVHRRHAVLNVSQDGVFSIHDLATKNGVAVNGARISQQNLNDGDVIELGEVKLKFTANPNAVGRVRGA